MQTSLGKFLSNFNKEGFQKDLITWFLMEKRDLPWRQDQDPYKIWVSEIMLQQTRVDTVIPYFTNFIKQFPTIDALASANEDSVLKAWEGLGYYSRARNLQTAVKEVVSEYNGKIPDNVEEISKLKGVGPYTQGAILSIAYGIPEPAVDGNVMRVLSRILYIWDDIAKQKTRKLFENAVRELISNEFPSEFNQGLMELGAIVCTPRSPSCLLCPVQDHCAAFREGTQEELPVKAKKKAAKEVMLTVLVLENKEGKILIHKRASKGLLANLWELPNHEMIAGIGTEDAQLVDFMKNEYKLNVTIEDQFMTIKHEFSHLIWKMTVYKGITDQSLEGTNRECFIAVDELPQFVFPVPFQKILEEYLSISSYIK